MTYIFADVADVAWEATVVVNEPETMNGTREKTGEDDSKGNCPCLKVGRYTDRSCLNLTFSHFNRSRN